MSFSTLSETWADAPLFVATLAVVAATACRASGIGRDYRISECDDQDLRHYGRYSLGLTIIVGFVRAYGQVAPARHPLQSDRDDGPFGDLHRRQLAVPRA